MDRGPGTGRTAYVGIVENSMFFVARVVEGTAEFKPLYTIGGFTSFADAQHHADTLNEQAGMDKVTAWEQIVAPVMHAAHEAALALRTRRRRRHTKEKR